MKNDCCGEVYNYSKLPLFSITILPREALKRSFKKLRNPCGYHSERHPFSLGATWESLKMYYIIYNPPSQWVICLGVPCDYLCEKSVERYLLQSSIHHEPWKNYFSCKWWDFPSMMAREEEKTINGLLLWNAWNFPTHPLVCTWWWSLRKITSYCPPSNHVV